MKTKLFAILLLAGSSLFARTHIAIGVGFGGYGYYPPPPVAVYAPPPAPYVGYAVPAYPGPGYTWIDGYYYPVGPRWAWRAGYWARRPYPRAYWVRPRYYGGRWFAGYWRR